MNVDILLIGRYLGAGSLGHYQNARSLTDEIRARIAMPLQRVLFPAFSAIQAERGRLQSSVLLSGRLLSAIVFPIGFGISAVSEELVPVLYGSQWMQMIPVLSVLGLSAAVRGATAISSPLFNSQNRVGLALRYNVVGTCIFVMGALVAMPYGLETVAAAIALCSLYSIVTFRAGLRLVGLSARSVFEILGGPFVASLAMWIGISQIRLVSSGWTDRAELLLICHVIAGAVIYCISLVLVSREYVAEFALLLRKISGRP
jgi:PST family polysaccharide transporter